MSKKITKPNKWLLKGFRMQVQDIERLENLRDSFLPMKKIIPLSTLVSTAIRIVSKMPREQVLKTVDELNKERELNKRD